jgi:hypothetical protein
MTYQCDYCTLKPFAIKGWLDRHVKEKHPNLEPLQKQELLFSCDTCKSIYKTSAALKRHKSKRHDTLAVPKVVQQVPKEFTYMVTRSKIQNFNTRIEKLVDSTEANLQELKKMKMEVESFMV